MSDRANIDALRDLAQRYIWLLAELHGGNEFSKDQLWRWLEQAEPIMRKTDADRTPGAS